MFMEGGPLIRAGCVPGCILTERMATHVPMEWWGAKVNATLNEKSGVISPLEDVDRALPFAGHSDSDGTPESDPPFESTKTVPGDGGTIDLGDGHTVSFSPEEDPEDVTEEAVDVGDADVDDTDGVAEQVIELPNGMTVKVTPSAGDSTDAPVESGDDPDQGAEGDVDASAVSTEAGGPCNEQCEDLFLSKCLPFHTVLSTAGEGEEVFYWYLGVNRGRAKCAKEISDGGVWRRGPDGPMFMEGGPLIRAGCVPGCILTERMATHVPMEWWGAKVNATLDEKSGEITPVEDGQDEAPFRVSGAEIPSESTRTTAQDDEATPSDDADTTIIEPQLDEPADLADPADNDGEQVIEMPNGMTVTVKPAAEADDDAAFGEPSEDNEDELPSSEVSAPSDPGTCNEQCETVFFEKCLPYHTVVTTANELDEDVVWYLGVERGREKCAKEISEGGVWRRGPDGLIFLKGGPALRMGCVEGCRPTEKMATHVPVKYWGARINATLDEDTGAITPIPEDEQSYLSGSFGGAPRTSDALPKELPTSADTMTAKPKKQEKDEIRDGKGDKDSHDEL